MTPTERLVAKLMDACAVIGHRVEEPVIRPARGYWSHIQQDVMSWQGTIRIDDRDYSIGSWDNITTLARRGFTIERAKSGPYDRSYVDIELHARPKRNALT